MRLLTYIPFIVLALAGCNAKTFYDDTYSDSKKMTLGVVQKEIRPGMSQDELAIALGSPNIVTNDKDNKETWIYDKIATQVRSSGCGGFLLFCQTGADYVNRNEVSQRTLTVVIKFDQNKKVETVTHHSSQF